MRLGRNNDSILAQVNRADARKAYATTASKGTTVLQMLLMTGGLLIASMVSLHCGLF